MYKFSQRSYNTLKGIHPDLITVLVTAIQNSPYDFTLTNGVRTTSEQQELYSKGRSQPGPKVTYTDGIKNKSNHQLKEDSFGYAVDLYPYFEGAVQVQGEEVAKRLTAIAQHIIQTGKKLNIMIEWGGNWKSFKDTPHFELKK
ncbi:M15 family metallopeptidase [Apibacter sp. HY039]|uniref:M15 family metallopeptidase n=1 Tax=Apibacter sp. HY039 TaxID=2501476 RepID=UPI000FEBC935|nr:M15 family metallopeptidase [Apibacter sp. HY039]